MMDILLKLSSKKANVYFLDIITKIANQQDINLKDYEVREVKSVVRTYKDEILEYIFKYGISSLINTVSLNEEIVARGSSQNQIIQTLHKYLDSISIDNELIIIDPYFFPSPNNDYIQFINNILNKYLSNISKLVIISLPNFNVNTKNSFLSDFNAIKPDLNIEHKTTDIFHDRFWISGNREKGIITGTSLNGLGRKYSLIDRLNINDVKEIVSVLKQNNLI